MMRYDKYLELGLIPKEYNKDKIGYYPVTSDEEWENLPAPLKVMEWFPVEVYNVSHKKRELSYPEYVVFDVSYMEPYKISAKVQVHVQDVHKILYCYYTKNPCQLYNLQEVVFQNGVRYPAYWEQDSISGAFGIYSGKYVIGKQGGFDAYIPSNVKKNEDGEWKFSYDGRGFDGNPVCYCRY